MFFCVCVCGFSYLAWYNTVDFGLTGCSHPVHSLVELFTRTHSYQMTDRLILNKLFHSECLEVVESEYYNQRYCFFSTSRFIETAVLHHSGLKRNAEKRVCRSSCSVVSSPPPSSVDSDALGAPPTY